MVMLGINKTSCSRLVDHTNIIETTIIWFPLASVPEIMVTMSRFLPSFLPTFMCLSICASCVQNRSAINVGRPSKRITVCDCFIYHARYFYRSRNSRKRMKRVGEKNRCLEKEKERKRVWNVGRKKISRIIKDNL